MHVFAALGELSSSMLVTLLMLAVSALPVESSQSELTPETFEPSIKNGLWFIEHFSPYCGHCKAFKPTWDQLVVESEKEVPSVRLGAINCIIHGDLCNQNGIEGWPTMLMFDHGKIVGQFKGARDLDRLKKFIKKYVKEEPQTPNTIPASHSSNKRPSPPPPAPPPPPAVVNPTGEVSSLDHDLFTTTLLKGPAFIKFFAPWCGHCKKLAPTWKQLARHMKNKLTIAEVNCDDNPSLCKSQNIEGYPTLVFFDGNGGKSEYNGGRKLDQLKTFSEKASAVGVHTLNSPDDLEVVVAKEDVIYLLLHSPQDTEIVKFVTEAAAPLLGSPAIYASSSPELHSQYPIQTGSHWSIIVHKDHDTHLPSSTFYGSYGVTQAKLRTWLMTHRLPTTLELTQDTFQGVMNAPQAPLVVIAAVSQADKNDNKIRDQFRELAKKWRWRTEGSGMVNGREVVFTWMDMDVWGKWMKAMYGIQPNDDHHHDHGDLEDVKVIIADHSKLIYYETDRLGSPIKMSSSKKLFPAVDDAALGKSSYKHSENYVERGARFLSDKLKPVETFVYDKPYHAILILTVGLAVVFWILYKLIGNDTASYHAYKGKNGRLD